MSTPIERFAALPEGRHLQLRRLSEVLDEIGLVTAHRAKGLQPCGSWAAYKRHLRHGEQPCEACAEASRRRDRARSPRTSTRERVANRKRIL